MAEVSIDTWWEIPGYRAESHVSDAGILGFAAHSVQGNEKTVIPIPGSLRNADNSLVFVSSCWL